MVCETTPPERWVEGATLGVSSWLTLEQDRIDRFADVTDDVEPLHNDPDWCADHSPFGRPISHGFLTLSLLTRFLHEITDNVIAGAEDRMGFPLNYGFDRVRFLAPVPVGARIRCRLALVDRRPHPDGDLMRFGAQIEIEGQEKLALSADWLTLWVTDGEVGAAARVCGT